MKHANFDMTERALLDSIALGFDENIEKRATGGTVEWVLFDSETVYGHFATLAELMAARK